MEESMEKITTRECARCHRPIHENFCIVKSGSNAKMFCVSCKQRSPISDSSPFMIVDSIGDELQDEDAYSKKSEATLNDLSFNRVESKTKCDDMIVAIIPDYIFSVCNSKSCEEDKTPVERRFEWGRIFCC